MTMFLIDPQLGSAFLNIKDFSALYVFLSQVQHYWNLEIANLDLPRKWKILH
jgi:hypothetical protein